eukprot:EG_transcript_1440
MAPLRGVWVSVLDTRSLAPPPRATSATYVKVAVGKQVMATGPSADILAPRWREKFYFSASEEASLTLHIVDEGMPPAEYRAMASVPLRQLSLSRGPVEDGYPVLDRAGMEVGQLSIRVEGDFGAEEAVSSTVGAKVTVLGAELPRSGTYYVAWQLRSSAARGAATRGAGRTAAVPDAHAPEWNHPFSASLLSDDEVSFSVNSSEGIAGQGTATGKALLDHVGTTPFFLTLVGVNGRPAGRLNLLVAPSDSPPDPALPAAAVAGMASPGTSGPKSIIKAGPQPRTVTFVSNDGSRRPGTGSGADAFPTFIASTSGGVNAASPSSEAFPTFSSGSRPIQSQSFPTFTPSAAAAATAASEAPPTFVAARRSGAGAGDAGFPTFIPAAKAAQSEAEPFPTFAPSRGGAGSDAAFPTFRGSAAGSDATFPTFVPARSSSDASFPTFRPAASDASSEPSSYPTFVPSRGGSQLGSERAPTYITPHPLEDTHDVDALSESAASGGAGGGGLFQEYPTYVPSQPEPAPKPQPIFPVHHRGGSPLRSRPLTPIATVGSARPPPATSVAPQSMLDPADFASRPSSSSPPPMFDPPRYPSPKQRDPKQREELLVWAMRAEGLPATQEAFIQWRGPGGGRRTGLALPYDGRLEWRDALTFVLTAPDKLSAEVIQVEALDDTVLGRCDVKAGRLFDAAEVGEPQAEFALYGPDGSPAGLLVLGLELKRGRAPHAVKPQVAAGPDGGLGQQQLQEELARLPLYLPGQQRADVYTIKYQCAAEGAPVVEVTGESVAVPHVPGHATAHRNREDPDALMRSAGYTPPQPPPSDNSRLVRLQRFKPYDPTDPDGLGAKSPMYQPSEVPAAPEFVDFAGRPITTKASPPKMTTAGLQGAQYREINSNYMRYGVPVLMGRDAEGRLQYTQEEGFGSDYALQPPPLLHAGPDPDSPRRSPPVVRIGERLGVPRGPPRILSTWDEAAGEPLAPARIVEPEIRIGAAVPVVGRPPCIESPYAYLAGPTPPPVIHRVVHFEPPYDYDWG